LPIGDDGALVLESRDGNTFLALSAIDSENNCVATLDRAGKLHVTHRITSVDVPWAPASLPAFLAALHADWRGWPGSREWRSIEGDITLSCTHDGLGHIAARVTIESIYREWMAVDTLILEAGALGELARDSTQWHAAVRE
jgi:Family of unknown function (DUF6228)